MIISRHSPGLWQSLSLTPTLTLEENLDELSALTSRLTEQQHRISRIRTFHIHVQNGRVDGISTVFAIQSASTASASPRLEHGRRMAV